MNKAFLIGNLTKDPELRTTPNNISVCTFSIAVNRRFATASGDKITDYFNIVAWRGLGENCAKYLAKGKKCSVVGEIQNRSYDDKNGIKRYVTEIIADDVEFLTPKSSGDSQSGNYSQYPPPAPQEPSQMGFEEIGDDEDLPF